MENSEDLLKQTTRTNDIFINGGNDVLGVKDFLKIKTQIVTLEKDGYSEDFGQKFFFSSWINKFILSEEDKKRYNISSFEVNLYMTRVGKYEQFANLTLFCRSTKNKVPMDLECLYEYSTPTLAPQSHCGWSIIFREKQNQIIARLMNGRLFEEIDH